MTTIDLTPCQEDMANRRRQAELDGRPRIEPSAFDHLITPPLRGSGTNALALREAARMCGGCQVRDACLLIENRDEEWAQAVVAELVRQTDGAA